MSIKKPKRPQAHEGTRVLYPIAIQERYGIAHVTRWRWERDGILPPRDFPSRGRPMGWMRATIEAWESRSPIPSNSPARATR